MATDHTDSLFEAPPPSAALRAFVEADLSALARRRRIRMAVFSALGLAGVLGMGWSAASASPAQGTLLHTLVIGGFAGAGLALVGLAFGVTLPSGRRLLPWALGAVVFGLAMHALMGSHDPADAVPITHGVGCLAKGAGIAVAIVLMAAVLGRRLLRQHAPTGLLLGIGAGLLGTIPIHIACPVLDPVHLLLWHGLVPVLSGALVGFIWSAVER